MNVMRPDEIVERMNQSRRKDIKDGIIIILFLAVVSILIVAGLVSAVLN